MIDTTTAPEARAAAAEPRFPTRVRIEALIVAILVIAMRSWRLTTPGTLIFDEVYYASDAVDLLRHGVEGGTAVHPPLGKWMLAIGLEIFGFEPLGWRIVPLLCGGAVAGLTYLIGWRLIGRRWAAVSAVAMVAFDGVMITSGRVAMLDGLVALWTTIVVLALVDLVRRPLDARHRRTARWWIAAAVGCGVATKWSAALLVPVAVLVVAALDWRYLPRPSWRRYLTTVVGMVGIVVGVYLVAYLPWFVNYDQTRAAAEDCEAGDCEYGIVDRVSGFVGYQRDVADFHRNLEPRHPDVARGWTWVVQQHPVDLFQLQCTPGLADSIASEQGFCDDHPDAWVRVIALGNPLVWLSGTVALLAVAVRAVWRRHGPSMVIAGVGWAMWVPWLLGSRPGYTFYGATLVPVLAASVVLALDWAGPAVRRWWWVIAVVQLAAAAWLWPVWIGIPLAPEDLDRILVFDSWQS